MEELRCMKENIKNNLKLFINICYNLHFQERRAADAGGRTGAGVEQGIRGRSRRVGAGGRL